MDRKPEIQYIGQFYIHGSEAKKLATRTKEKQARTTLPEVRPQQIREVHVDPVAIGAIAVAVLMLAVIVFGALQLQSAWADYDIANEYVSQLKQTNRDLDDTYRRSYDLDEIRAEAESMGMVPVSEVTLIPITVTVPEPTPEPTAWDDFLWFMKGLFA